MERLCYCVAELNDALDAYVSEYNKKEEEALEVARQADLLPCPFCGGGAIVSENMSYAHCECMRCESTGQEFDKMGGQYDAVAAAKRAWNKRHC